MASSRNVLKEILPEVLAARDILARDEEARRIDREEAAYADAIRKQPKEPPELHRPLPSEPVEIRAKNVLTDPGSWLNTGLRNLAGNAASVILGEPSGNGLVDLGAANVPGVGAGAILAAGGMPGIVDVVPGAGAAAKAVRRLPNILARDKNLLASIVNRMEPKVFLERLNNTSLDQARYEYHQMALTSQYLGDYEAANVFENISKMENPVDYFNAIKNLGITNKEGLYRAFPDEYSEIIAAEAKRNAEIEAAKAAKAAENKRVQDINNAYSNFEVQLKKLEKNPQKYISKAEASGKSLDELLAIPPELPNGVSREALEARKAAALEKATPVTVEAPAAPVEAPVVPEAPVVDLKAQRAAEKAAKEAEKQARRKARQAELRAAEEAKIVEAPAAPQQPPRRPYEAPSMSSVETPGSSRILMSVVEPEAPAAKTVASLTDAERSYMERVGGVLAAKPAWKKMEPYLKENGLGYKDVRKYNELKAIERGETPYDWLGNGWKSSEHPLSGGLEYEEILGPGASEQDRRMLFGADSIANHVLRNFSVKQKDALKSLNPDKRRHDGSNYDRVLSPMFNEEVLYSMEKGNIPSKGNRVTFKPGWNDKYQAEQANMIGGYQDLYDLLFRTKVQKEVDRLGGFRR